MAKLIPTSHNLIVKERIYEQKLKSGLVLPSDVAEKGQYATREGIVVDMSPDCFDYSPEEYRPKIGDVVRFQKYAGDGMMYAEVPYRILLDEEVRAFTDKYIDPDEELNYGS